MPRDMLTGQTVDSTEAVRVHLNGQPVGWVALSTYEDMDAPDYKRATFDAPEWYEQPDDADDAEEE